MNSAPRFICILIIAVCSAAAPGFTQPDRQLQITSVDSSRMHFTNAFSGKHLEAIQCDTIKIARIHIDSSGQISWVFNSKADTFNYQLEVFKWNKWVAVKTFQTYREKGSQQNITDTTKITLHNGTNRFRLRFEQPCTWVSPELAYENKKGTPCKWPLRVTDELVLESEQEWIIYNAYGYFKMKGSSRIVSLSTLEKGSYFLIGSKQIIEFIKH